MTLKRNLRYIRDDFRLTTWLLIGAFLQASLLAIFPTNIAVAPVLLILSSRIFYFFMVSQGILPDESLKDVRPGRTSTRIPSTNGRVSSKPSAEGVVVFILGARSSHIRGRLAPGMAEMGHEFAALWREAKEHREEYGYLGKTSPMVATESDCNNTTIYISYWRSLEHLYKFANATAHSKAWVRFNKAKARFPHIGLMHELYNVPKNHWETIYVNLKPFGLGNIRLVTEESKNKGQTLSSLVDLAEGTLASSRSRQGFVEE